MVTGAVGTALRTTHVCDRRVEVYEQTNNTLCPVNDGCGRYDQGCVPVVETAHEDGDHCHTLNRDACLLRADECFYDEPLRAFDLGGGGTGPDSEPDISFCDISDISDLCNCVSPSASRSFQTVHHSSNQISCTGFDRSNDTSITNLENITSGTCEYEYNVTMNVTSVDGGGPTQETITLCYTESFFCKPISQSFHCGKCEDQYNATSCRGHCEWNETTSTCSTSTQPDCTTSSDEDNNNYLGLYIGLPIAAVILIGIIIVVWKKRKGKVPDILKESFL